MFVSCLFVVFHRSGGFCWLLTVQLKVTLRGPTCQGVLGLVFHGCLFDSALNDKKGNLWFDSDMQRATLEYPGDLWTVTFYYSDQETWPDQHFDLLLDIHGSWGTWLGWWWWSQWWKAEKESWQRSRLIRTRPHLTRWWWWSWWEGLGQGGVKKNWSGRSKILLAMTIIMMIVEGLGQKLVGRDPSWLHLA